MHAEKLENTNINSIDILSTPLQIKKEAPIDLATSHFMAAARREISRVVTGKDQRLLVIVGPCSIHDHEQAVEYAKLLLNLRRDLGAKLCIIMRVYFEKPRTTNGWRGLILDPHLDGSFDIERGIRQAREILLHIAKLGMPTASEILDPIIPQYISDLISWAAIGARTTESQVHREMASGLSMPVGFKNSTDGSFANSINAMEVAMSAHSFLGINEAGSTAIVKTKGNDTAHIILRGGKDGPNYTKPIVKQAIETMKERNLQPSIIVDCSHANSNKDFKQQPRVCTNIVEQYVEERSKAKSSPIRGFMLESHLNEGRQEIVSGREKLQRGVSLTDGCISWETTENLLKEIYAKI